MRRRRRRLHRCRPRHHPLCCTRNAAAQPPAPVAAPPSRLRRLRCARRRRVGGTAPRGGAGEIAAGRAARPNSQVRPRSAHPTSAVPAPAPAPPAAATAATLNLADLEQRLRETRAIGVFTKLSLKNQVDDLLKAFRALYRDPNKRPSAELRQRYDGLLLKVLSLLQDGDPPLAAAIASSREAIWGILADPEKFAKMDT